MAKHSDDYIPTYADRMAEIDKLREYARTHGDPRAKYAIKYKMFKNGPEHTEEVWALTQNDAIVQLKKGWSMNGIYVDVIGAMQIEKSEAEKMAEAKAKEQNDDGAGVQD